jgi:hypothetical protein
MSHHYPDAATLAQIFNGYFDGTERRAEMVWPETFSLLGRALDVSYLSDKEEGGGIGEEQEYIHFHPTPVALLMPYAPDRPTFGRWLAPPNKGEFAFCGYCIEASYTDSVTGDDLTLHFADLGSLPYLGADPHKGMLCILPQWGGDPLILWGPQLRVEARGIVG